MDGSPRTLLAVHAHPDDECVSTGGILARYGAEGVRTVVVTCTRGEIGEISDPALATPENLAEVREREMREAVRILKISRAVQLGYRDSGMAGTPDNDHPDAFQRVDMEQALRRLVQVIREERPQVIVTYNENGGYGHPDHIQAHRLAVAGFHAAGDAHRFPEAGPPWATSKLYYTVFPRGRLAQALQEAGLELPFEPPDEPPEDQATTAVDVSAYLDVKRAALLAHRTQVGPEHFFARLPLPLLHRAWSHEYFNRVMGPATEPEGEQEGDLFAGL